MILSVQSGDTACCSSRNVAAFENIEPGDMLHTRNWLFAYDSLSNPVYMPLERCVLSTRDVPFISVHALKIRRRTNRVALITRK